MLYLQTRTILVEIFKPNHNQPLYLIGDQELAFIPQSIWKASFKNANWNRALKYEVDSTMKTIHSEANSTSRYLSLRFNLYLAFNPTRVVSLAFNQFENKILHQEDFILQMLPRIIESYEKNHQSSLKLNDDQLANNYLELTNKPLIDINGFLVNADFDLNNSNYRWNYLIKLGQENKISFSKNKQLIYEVDAKLFNDSWYESFLMVDLVEQHIYFQGYVEVQNHHHLNLAINYEEPLILLIRDRIIRTLEPVFTPILGSDQNKFFHYYNLTQEVKYLVEFMNTTKDLGYFAWKTLCDEIFAFLNLNYYEPLYCLEEIKPYLFAKVTGLEILIDLIKNLHRFGTLTPDEQVKINELNKETI